MSIRATIGSGLVLAMLGLTPSLWGQEALRVQAAADTTLRAAQPLAAPLDATPLPSLTTAKSELRTLPPLPERAYSVKSPPLPLPMPGDTVIVPQISTKEIVDPELKARADSLNRSIRLYAIQERLLEAEMTGTAPHVGLLTRQDYLQARLQLLRSMESGIQEELKRRLADLDVTIAALDSTVDATRGQEIAALEDFIARYPDSRQVADAKFILGQLYYKREQARFIESTRRFTTEFQRYRLGLLPVAPKIARMDESVPVPYYRDVLRLGTNRDLVPYSLYSLGKYHLEQAADYGARVSEARSLHSSEDLVRYERLQAEQMDTAKAYFARLIVEFPDDTVNVPESYYVLASHYNVRGGQANRDTAAVYCQAIVRDHWYSPRYQASLMLLAEINFASGVGTVAFPGRPDYQEKKALRNRYFADALAYLAWLARDIDAYKLQQIPGVSPDPTQLRPLMMEPSRQDRAIQFMTQMITRPSPPGMGLEPPPPVETAVRLVAAAGNPPFGADLLRQVGDRKNQDYNTTQNPADLVAALTSYDSLLSRYATYRDGPRIQQQIIDNATFLSENPQERLDIYVNQKISYFERFNRNSEWAKQSDAPETVRKTADDSAAVYLEQGARYLYTQAQAAGDRGKLRKALDHFVRYFQTYPERPQAYELNWSLATELRDLGDYERAYQEFMRVSNAQLGKYREDAALEAVAAAQQLLDAEHARTPAPEAPPR